MDETTIAAVYDYVKNSDVHTLDITGGAPELHPQFRELVAKVRALNVSVIIVSAALPGRAVVVAAH